MPNKYNCRKQVSFPTTSDDKANNLDNFTKRFRHKSAQLVDDIMIQSFITCINKVPAHFYTYLIDSWAANNFKANDDWISLDGNVTADLPIIE